MTKIAVIIVAAGRGMRAGEGQPKQYRHIVGKSVLRRTVENVAEALPGTPIQVVIGATDKEPYAGTVDGLELLPPVIGDSTRQESVLNGLKAVKHLKPEFVLIHDAARPFITEKLINSVVAELENGAKAVVPALPIVDTLNRVEGTTVAGRIDRTGLFSVQTPQGFEFKALIDAHKACTTNDYTDDGTVMEAAGHSVKICAGDEANFKLTHKQDFKKAEGLLMHGLGDIRTGSGYDVHRFEAGTHLWLCGLKIPFEKSLKGHSDADVGLHALTDALLAAVAAGDIGTHFPPSENKWRGASSDLFVRKAAKIIQEMGGIVSNVSVCLICEQPKISPHTAEMRQKIASLLDIALERVSVQATTTEKLGFTGRSEGIAAQATATVRLPF